MVVVHDLRDLVGSIGDKRVRAGRPLVGALCDGVLPDRRPGGHRREPDERRVRLCELDLKSEVVDRLQTKGGKRGVDCRRIALRVHQRHTLPVLHRVSEQRLVGRSQARVDQPLPRIDEVLRFDRSAVPVFRVGAQVEDVGSAVAVDIEALRRGRHNAAQVRVGPQERLGDRTEHRGLIRVLRLSGVERRGLVFQHDPQDLILGQLWPHRDAGVTRRRHHNHKQHDSDGANHPSD